MSIDRSVLPPPDNESGGGESWFSKPRNLIIAAAVIGGGIGLIVFLNRKPAATSSGGTVQFGAGDLSMQSLANQVLQFRGEQSMFNADLEAALEAGFGSVGEGIDRSYQRNETLFQSDREQTDVQYTALSQFMSLLLGRINQVDTVVQANSELGYSINEQAGARATALTRFLSQILGEQRASSAQLSDASQRQTSSILAIDETLSASSAAGTTALGGLSSQLSGYGNMLRGLTALGEGQSAAFGDASVPRFDGLFRRLAQLQPVSATGSGYNGPAGTGLPTMAEIDDGNLSAAYDGGTGDLAQWLSTIARLPVRRVA